MDDVIFRYVQEKAIQDLREKQYLEEDVADELNSGKWLESLRKHVVPNDKTWLLEIAKVRTTNLAELCISLMRPVKDESDVRKFLFDTWNDHSASYLTKMQVMWRLLDYPDLSEASAESIYNYVQSDWNRWIKYMVDKFGGQDGAYDFCVARLANWIFPESKKWVYLCVLAGADRSEDAKRVISGYVDSSIRMNAKVAGELLRKLA